jgi:hypothetical protein
LKLKRKTITKTHQMAPQKVINTWGEKFPAAIEHISQRLTSIGWIGPLTWRQSSSIPYLLNTSDSIRVILSLSKCGGNANAALFDGVASIWSKSIHDKTIPDDPWSPIGHGYEKWHVGYVPCLTYRLSHLKWAEAESAINPAWAMTLESDESSEPNATAWLADFETLLLPRLLTLKSDGDLTQAMLHAINYVRPSWVKSDGPGFGGIRELLVALNRSGSTPIGGSMLSEKNKLN